VDLTERHQLDHHIITTANNQMAIPWQPNSTAVTTKANHHFKMTMNTSLQQPLVSSYELDLDLLEVGEDKP
jgi:DNA/RNA endonuclease G (NUC1)